MNRRVMTRIAALTLAALATAGCDAQTPATPTTLATAPGSPGGLSVDVTHVYWTSAGSPANGGTVLRVPNDGGGVEVLAKGQSGPFALRADETRVFWGNRGTGFRDGELMQLSKPSGGPVRLVGTLAGPTDIALAGAELIAFIDPDPTSPSAQIKTFTLGQATPDSEISGGPQVRPDSIASGAGGYYWTDTDAGMVMFHDKTNRTTQEIVNGEDRPRGIAFDGGYLYWANVGSRAGADGSLRRVQVGADGFPAGAPATLVDNQNIGGRGRIALADGYVYWINVEGDEHHLMYAPEGGGTPTALAIGQGASVIDLAVHQNSAYWTLAGEAEGSVLTVKVR